MSQPEPLRFRPIDLTGVYVLVVDDYEDTRELFRSALEAFGAEVVTARSARDALTAVNFFSQSWACSIIVGRSFNSGFHPSFIS